MEALQGALEGDDQAMNPNTRQSDQAINRCLEIGAAMELPPVPVCVTIEEFKEAVARAKTEMEVRRILLHSLSGLVGTDAELAEAFAFADACAAKLITIP